MLLIHKYEPLFAVEEKHFDIIRHHEELLKIMDFIDLPEKILNAEQQNSAILRNYYANAIDHNQLDLKTVKYIYHQNIRAKGLSEKSAEQFGKAETWLGAQLNEPLSIGMIFHLQKLLISDVYNNREDINLFTSHKLKVPEKLAYASEMEIESLFDFLNNDTDFHPIHQSWILHFRLLGLQIFSEAKSKMASLLQHFWLRKKGYDLKNLLCLDQEIFQHRNEYRSFTFENDPKPNPRQQEDMNGAFRFGMKRYGEHLLRLKNLLKSYYRKQVEFERLNVRQKNVMNFVFENGYKLKEIDDSVLNKRQKLIMYFIQNKGFISTKDLVTEFDCNRKTIQRDFTLLTDLKLVRVIGQGAGLRYSVNISDDINPEMKKYRPEFLKEEITGS
ncbi:MAG: HTH domain-containing protein [Bacteroidia bacterium]